MLSEAEIRTLRRLAAGDILVYSQDGDVGWFPSDRAILGDDIIFSLRDKGLIERRIDPDDDTDNYRGMAEFDTITEAGKRALAEAEGRE